MRGFLRAYVRAVLERRGDLSITAVLLLALVIGSGVAMHLLERRAQPEAFGTLAACLYWASMTVTTVGYGDLAPATGAGRLVAVLTAFIGAGFLVVTAGILAAGFVEEMEKHPARRR